MFAARFACCSIRPQSRDDHDFVVAFSVCFIALLAGGIMAMRGASETAPIKYIIFLVYGGLYGFFGIAFSLLAGKSANTEVTKDA
jgi:hypothetical protein